jgi:hypothetical protein
LKFAITEENFENILVLLVASMAQPWSIMESLNKWASYLQEHIDRLKLKPEDRREYEESCKLLITTPIPTEGINMISITCILAFPNKKGLYLSMFNTATVNVLYTVNAGMFITAAVNTLILSMLECLILQ